MIKLYSTHCPKCRIVEMKIKQKGIPCEIVDDLDTVVKIGQENHIMSAPILQVDDVFLKFDEAVKYINERN